jgi:hypothetical protein
MLQRVRPLCFVAGLLAVVGCMGAQTRIGKLQESTQNFNQAARFGRMDIAMELVETSSKDRFVKQHNAWGRDVRLVDLEMQGMRLKDKDTAVVLLTVGWQRVDEQELRVTQVEQTWAHGYGGWRIVQESRAAGDYGLLGEPIVVMRPESHTDVHFRSITIR